MLSFRQRPALRLTLLYTLFAFTWLFLLEHLLATLPPAGITLEGIDAYLDLSFILLTVPLFYRLLQREFRRRQEIETAQQRLQALFDNALDAILLADDRGHYIAANPAASHLLGYSREELLSMSVEDITVPEMQEQVRQQWENFLREGRMSGEFPVRCRQGHIRATEFRAVAHVQPGLHLSILRDISERKEAEQALWRQNRKLVALHEEVERHARGLEQRVAERTVELRQANARLQAEIRERQQAEAAERAVLQNLARHEERQRIARELHDTTSQSLWSIAIMADVLPELWEQDAERARERSRRLQQLAAGALAEMRTLLVELRPDALAETPLPELVQQLVTALQNHTRATIQADFQGTAHLGEEMQHNLYRIVQEALNNVVRHAQATQVKLTLRCESEHLFLQIEDNGVGFAQGQASPGHMGMRFMQERARQIGASLTVASKVGAGTSVIIAWPGEEGERNE